MATGVLERAGEGIYAAKKFYNRNKKSIDRKFFIFYFLALPIVLFCIFYIYVNIDSFTMAFKQDGLNEAGVLVEHWTFDNFKNVWGILTADTGGVGILTEAIINTMLFNAVNIGLILPVTTLICYFISKKIFGYRFFRAIFYLPCIIASSALVILFKTALHDGGPLMVLFGEYGIFPSGYTYPLSQAPSAIITILAYNFLFGLGGNIIVLGGAMRSVDPQMLEAGQIDGCNWVSEFFYIILPSIWPTISTILILSVAGFLGATGPILPFTEGANGTMTLSFYIFALVSGKGAKTDYYLASAIGLCMTIISFPLAMLVKRLLYGKEK